MRVQTLNFFTKNSERIFTNTVTATSPNISCHLAVKNAWNLFINIMPWPAKIVKLFDLAKSGGEMDESEFYGPFNAVLNYLFPYEEDYSTGLFRNTKDRNSRNQ